MKKEVKLYKETVLEAFYNALKDNSYRHVHIPHSKVFYIRAAIQERTGIKYSLEHIENAMLVEGWKDG